MLAGVLLAAGCGGSKGEPPPKIVRGTGFTFEVIATWQVARSGRQVQAVEGGKSLALVAVSRFPLIRRYRPGRFERVTKELDAAARGIAQQQGGVLSTSDTIELGGEQARRYDVAYETRGRRLVERIGFVLRGKTEYLLLCRYPRNGDTDPCDQLFSSFRLAQEGLAKRGAVPPGRAARPDAAS